MIGVRRCRRVPRGVYILHAHDPVDAEDVMPAGVTQPRHAWVGCCVHEEEMGGRSTVVEMRLTRGPLMSKDAGARSFVRGRDMQVGPA